MSTSWARNTAGFKATPSRLRIRDELTQLADKHGAALKIVELPPGPPVLSSVVAEVYGQPDQSYANLLHAADIVSDRFHKEPGMADIDTIRETPIKKLVFITDQEKAALAGVTVDDVARTIRLGLEGANDETLRVEGERHPLRITIRLPQAERSSRHDLAAIYVKGKGGQLVPLSEIGKWQDSTVSQTIYHKNLERVAYAFAETVGRPPAECIADIATDRESPTRSAEQRRRLCRERQSQTVVESLLSVQRRWHSLGRARRDQA